MSKFSGNRSQKSKSIPLGVERLEAREVPAASLNDAFVASTYHALLRRDADANGLQYWSAVADAQGTGAVVQGIQDSQEHQALEVADLYTNVLGRTAGAAELNYWVGQRQAGHSQDEVSAEIYGSAEFANKTDHSTANALDQIYQKVLGRGVDDAGRSYWSGVIASGVSTGAAALAILHSDEAVKHDVRAMYTQLLGRAADDQGVDFWAHAAKQGDEHDDVVRGLLDSGEAKGKLQQQVNNTPLGSQGDANAIARAVEDTFHLSDDGNHQGGSTVTNNGSLPTNATDVTSGTKADDGSGHK